MKMLMTVLQDCPVCGDHGSYLRVECKRESQGCGQADTTPEEFRVRVCTTCGHLDPWDLPEPDHEDDAEEGAWVPPVPPTSV